MTGTWAGTSTSQSTATAASLDRVRTTVAVAQGLAASGRHVDLAGLDAAAGLLCAQILDLPPGEGASMRHALQDLRTKLTVLAKTIEHAR